MRLQRFFCLRQLCFCIVAPHGTVDSRPVTAQRQSYLPCNFSLPSTRAFTMLIKTAFILCAIGGFLSMAGAGDYIKDFTAMSNSRHIAIEQQVNGTHVAGLKISQETAAQKNKISNSY